MSQMTRRVHLDPSRWGWVTFFREKKKEAKIEISGGQLRVSNLGTGGSRPRDPATVTKYTTANHPQRSGRHFPVHISLLDIHY